MYKIKDAYNNKGWDIQAKFEEKTNTFTVELWNMLDDKRDCKIGFFGYNFYFRTRQGAKSHEKYKSWGYLIGAIKRVAKKYNLTFEYLLVKNNKFLNKELIK